MRRGEIAGRALVSVTLWSLAVMLIAGQSQVRRLEARVTGVVLRWVFGVDTLVSQLHPVVYVTTEPADNFVSPFWIGLTVTQECTVAWLLAPLLILSGLFVFGRRFAVRAVALAVLLTAVALSVVNVVRLVVIVMSTHLWGLDVGYRWSHDIYGSLITVFGVLLAAVLFVKLVIRLTKRIDHSVSPVVIGPDLNRTSS